MVGPLRGRASICKSFPRAPSAPNAPRPVRDASPRGPQAANRAHDRTPHNRNEGKIESVSVVCPSRPLLPRPARHSHRQGILFTSSLRRNRRILARLLHPGPTWRSSVASPPTKRFVHRENRDGTFDSICPACFDTVATAAREADLAKYEKPHVCDPWTLQRLARAAQTTPAKNPT